MTEPIFERLSSDHPLVELAGRCWPFDFEGDITVIAGQFGAVLVHGANGLLLNAPNLEKCEAALRAIARESLTPGHEAPRPFVLRRKEDETGVSGCGDVAWGVLFPDGTAVTRWCVTEIRQTCVWRSMDDVRYVHGHNGKTEVVFLDGGAE